MKVQIKKDLESEDYYLDVNDLSELFDDISIVEYYTIEEREDNSLVLSFFDKDNNKVYPKVK